MTKKTCADCECYKVVKGVDCCEDCFNQPIADIDDCPLGVTEEVISDIEKHAKENKVKIVNTSGEKKERKPRERKVDENKRLIVETLHKAISTIAPNATVVKVEKEITFDFNDGNYSISLIKHRKKKN